jgi:hypothetical protein
MTKLMEFMWLAGKTDVSVEVIKEENNVYAELAVYESCDGYIAVLNKEEIDELISLLEKAKGCFNE